MSDQELRQDIQGLREGLALLSGELAGAYERIAKLEEQLDDDTRRLWNHIGNMPGGV